MKKVLSFKQLIKSIAATLAVASHFPRKRPSR